MFCSQVNAVFRRLCNEQLAAWRGVIRCGALESRITLAPAPLPHMYVTDFESARLTMTTTLEICGFVAMQDIGQYFGNSIINYMHNSKTFIHFKLLTYLVIYV